MDNYEELTLHLKEITQGERHPIPNMANAPVFLMSLHDKDRHIVGVLDIDSLIKGRFTEADHTRLESFAKILENA